MNLDELEAGYQASLGGSSGVSLDALEQGYQSSLKRNTVNEVSNQLGKGLTFNWFNEFQGLEGAAQGLVADLFGRGNGQGFWEDYEANKAKSTQEDKVFAAENPKTALALNITGAAAPALIGGAVGLGAKGASGAVQLLARDLFGIGIKQAPTVMQLARMGAVGGALAGAGESEDNRLKGALTGGSVGAAVGPVLGKALQYGTQYAGDFAAENLAPLARKVIDNFGNPAYERGSLGDKILPPTQSGGGYTAAELALAKELKNTPLDKIARAESEIGTAIANDVPLFLPEALQSPKVDRNARFIANYDPSLEFSQSAIKARTEGAEGRASALFGAISPIYDIYTGAKRLATAADDIVTKAENTRTETVAPLYAKAYSDVPQIKSGALDELLSKDQVLSSTIKSLKKTANNADMPDNSTELLVKARHRIGDTIEDLKGKGKLQEARDLQDTYSRLNGILKRENPALADADSAYKMASEGIEALNDTFLKNLRNISDDKIGNVNQIFDLPAPRIEQLRGTFESAGRLDEWNAGIRSYFQKTVEASREGQNFTNKLTGSTFQKDKIRAALGDTAEPILDGLDFERRMFEGKNKYNAGSSTDGNLQERGAFEGTVKSAVDASKGNYLQAIMGMFKSDVPEEVAQELARIYFEPRTGLQALGRIAPLLDAYQKSRAAAAVAGTIGGQSSRINPLSARGSPRSDSQAAPIVPQGSLERETAAFQPSKAETQPGPLERSLSPEMKGPTKEPVSYAVDDTLYNDLFSTADLRSESVDPQTRKEFQSKVETIADDLGADPGHLLAVMKFETGGTLDPKEKNRAGSGATGLIQFMPTTAKDLTGASTKEAAIKLMESMSPVEQLDYVEKYLKPFKGKLNTLEDVYMAVLYPRAVGKDNDYVLFKEGTKAYWQNRGLDIDKDGEITKSEAASKVRRYNDVVDV